MSPVKTASKHLPRKNTPRADLSTLARFLFLRSSPPRIHPLPCIDRCSILIDVPYHAEKSFGITVP